MKKNLFLLLGTIMMLLSTPMLSSCGDDDDEPVPSTAITVSPANLSLLSEKSASVTFNVTCESTWTISGTPDWLYLSASGGTGSATITATALTQNASAETREAELTISCDDNTATVTISQLPAFLANCTVDFSNIMTMSTSIAWVFKCTGDVSYFRAMVIQDNITGYTDERLAGMLEESNTSFSPEEDNFTVFSYDGLPENTDIYLIALAFDANGNRGVLTKNKIHTLTVKNSSPQVAIYDIQYSATDWVWRTQKDNYTYQYYMGAWEAEAAEYYMGTSEAYIAYQMRGYINNKEIDPIMNSDIPWSIPRSNGSMCVLIATWAMSNPTDMSPVLTINGGYINSTSSSVAAARDMLQKKTRVGSGIKKCESLSHIRMLKPTKK